MSLRKRAAQGIAFLIDTGFIRSRAPADVARFLLHADGLNKAAIGEWLGEGCAARAAIDMPP
jgi:brefeldin A-inhibited guanine nucleotide-exchange protein